MRINPIYPQQPSRVFAFPSSLQSIDSLELLLDEIKEQFALSEHVYSSIWVCLNEGISNAIIHGNKQDITKKVHLSVELKWDNFICFTIRDEGDGFDDEAIPDPTKPELIDKPNGRGIFLMKKLADLALFSNRGTTVDLYFDLTKT
ncbi:MAG: ATP-binding protein [Bacteroidota bacterium]|jgi:serine/threonine-protein kinase RsbW|nr:ATP-binding protein [Bacteroidota bacterium]